MTLHRNGGVDMLFAHAKQQLLYCKATCALMDERGRWLQMGACTAGLREGSAKRLLKKGDGKTGVIHLLGLMSVLPKDFLALLTAGS